MVKLDILVLCKGYLLRQRLIKKQYADYVETKRLRRNSPTILQDL